MNTKISVVNTEKFKEIANSFGISHQNVVNVCKDEKINNVLLVKASDLKGLADGHDVVVVNASDLVVNDKQAVNDSRRLKRN
ncbi:MAG: hypothetical protein C0448_16120 [Sphingobacteriaceae bacterium]|nr:hypothetical protein [Sphingobacteriaceae bacterium]